MPLKLVSADFSPTQPMPMCWLTTMQKWAIGVLPCATSHFPEVSQSPKGSGSSPHNSKCSMIPTTTPTRRNSTGFDSQETRGLHLPNLHNRPRSGPSGAPKSKPGESIYVTLLFVAVAASFWGQLWKFRDTLLTWVRTSNSPGRFYISLTSKIVLAHLLLEYDIGLPSTGKLPRAFKWRTSSVPDPGTVLCVRPKEKEEIS